MSATDARHGDLVEYSDMANLPRVWEVLATPADIVPDGTLWQDTSAFELIDPETFETHRSDLRRHGWSIVQEVAR